MRKVPWIDLLVVRPRPKEGESFTGYLIRVTEANAYPNLAFILGHADGNIGGFTKVGKEKEARQQWRALEKALDLPEGEFQRRWPRKTYTSDMWQPTPLGSLPLVKADHAAGISHVCPDCLSEDGYCQALWEVRYYTVCHRHRRLMVSHCGACGQQLSVKRPTLRRCGYCDADLKIVCKPIPGDTVALAISGLLAKGVAEGDASTTEYESIDFPWHSVGDAFVAVDAIRMMGWMTEMRFKQWLAASEGAEVRQSHVVRTMRLFEDWPNKWFAQLEQDINERARVPSTIRGRLLHHESLLLASGSIRLRFMQQALADWLSERHPEIWTLKAFRPLAAPWQRGPGVVTAMHAAHLLGCTHPHIRWMANKGLLTTVPDIVGGSRFLVTRDSVEKARAAMRTTVTWHAANKVVKCDPHLIYNEWFRETMQAEQMWNCGHLRIRKERIRWLFDEISKAKAKRDQRAEVISMRQAVSMVMKVGGSYGWILRQILEGSLPVANFHRRRGIRGMRFYKRDVAALKMVAMGRSPLDAAILKEADRKMRAWS